MDITKKKKIKSCSLFKEKYENKLLLKTEGRTLK